MGGDADVLSVPVLVALALFKQLAQLVVTDLAVLVGRANARLGDTAGDGACLLAVHRQLLRGPDA